MAEQILFSINFRNTFISISRNILDIESKEDLNIDKSENFNTNV